uniref:Platelet glycoprotein 4 n=1 Tax=Poecilia reticulata TaxID=8081 RepID=A0A3P9QGT4_POERE
WISFLSALVWFSSYERTMNLKGIDVYRFSLHALTLASPEVNPDNKCFCSNMKTTKNCTLAGVLDISACQQGRPIYISLPHFLHGSPSLRTDVLGLNPHEEHHKTFLDVEPTSGFTLNFAKRIQVNMMYGPSKTATLDDETAEMFKKELISRIQMLEIIQQVLLGVGIGVFLLCLLGFFIVRRSHNKKELA